MSKTDEGEQGRVIKMSKEDYEDHVRREQAKAKSKETK